MINLVKSLINGIVVIALVVLTLTLTVVVVTIIGASALLFLFLMYKSSILAYDILIIHILPAIGLKFIAFIIASFTLGCIIMAITAFTGEDV